MRALAGHVFGVVVLQLSSGCGSSAGQDFFLEPSVARGGSSSGAPGAGGASAAGSSAGGAGGSSSGAGGTQAAGSGGSSGGTNTTFSGNGGFAGDEEPIDDMEDGDAQILVQGGRDGYWFVIADSTQGGWTSPGVAADFSMGWNATSRGESLRAAELMGGGFQQWGAGLVFNLRAWSEPQLAYDASSYSGISFYGRSGQGSLEVTVHVVDVNSHPDGGLCGAAPKPPCYRHFRSVVSMESAWQKFRIPFASLRQGEQSAATFTPAKLYAVQFMVEGDATFDLWIDDVAFIQ